VNTDKDVLVTAAEWRDRGMGVALATVVRTWGSAPRGPGSHMAINDAGDFCGSVSGGCVESAVVAAATEVIRSGHGQNLSFGVSDEMAWSVGLSCGGRVAIYVERVE
jgi:xanthine/CO dehydrogenase XdhC/CoxF family maturation factor